MGATVEVLRQHLIDPEICIRCNTCEETCPIDAITHDSRNYVVDPSICNACNACISPCPTGAIDNWRQVVRASAYSTDDQLAWDTLPAQEVIAKNFHRPTNPKVFARHRGLFPEMDLRLATSLVPSGRWDDVQNRFFAEGGVFDQLYARGR